MENDSKLLTDIWSLDKNGTKVFPCRVSRGANAGLFSVNFTNESSNYVHLTEEQLIEAIKNGKLKSKGTIRMLPKNAKPGANRNGYAPIFYLGIHISELN